MNEIIQVGKYKDKPIEILAGDPDYTEWLINQPWFREKYARQYNIIINNFCEPNETPQHNQLQAKFLQDKMAGALIRICLNVPDNCPIQIIDKRFENDGWDFAVRCLISKFCLLPKNINKDWYELTLTNRRDCEDHFGWGDPPFTEKDYGKIKMLETDLPSCHKWIGVELKPAIGDDYPNVLRQVKRHGSVARKVVIIGTFTSSAVSFQDVQKIFAYDNIFLLKLADVEALQSKVLLTSDLTTQG